MNKFYIQIVFFLLSIFICVNNKTLATGLTPKEQNNKTRVNVLTPKEHNNKTLATNLASREQIDKILATELTPREKCNKILDAMQKAVEQNKGPRVNVLTPKEHNNKTLATGLTPREQINKLYDTGVTPGEQSNKLFDAMLPPEELNKRNREYALSLEFHAKLAADTRKKIYIKNKDLLCTNPNEIANAEKFMNEAVTQLEHHITNIDGYKLRKYTENFHVSLLTKKHEDTIIQKINLKYHHVHKYNEITNIFWDPALANDLNNGDVQRKIVRVYNPNLVMIQQRYKSWFGGREKYFYALAKKVRISEEKTIIVMASVNINDGHPSKKEYKNKIIENVNVFRTQINSEDDIRNGKLKKTFANITGYLIEKMRSYVNVIYLESIDEHTSKYQKLILEKALNKFFNYEDDKLYIYP
ncbi:fam-a protein [Plasmodium vinckei brucechwatti]|uniref:Fam-a protein n=1 Tax=Plasmodium vinckei brucechwatti TaxID=119398 RepID=A0A6V7RW86_PLAVN|nr:fam-a protein [Plasmodium vinckei brucechwatti]